MRTVDVHGASGELAELLEELEKGREIVIARAGKPVARLVLLPPPAEGPRKLGGLRGKYKVPEDFDAPLPDDLLDLFEGR